MPINVMADDKDPLFVMTSLSDHRPQGVDGHGGLHYPHHHHHQEVDGVHLQQHGLHYLSSESFDEDHQSTTSSTESGSNVAHRKDHEFIPTRMKTISASKPAADPKQFTRVPSNPLLISAQKQLMQVFDLENNQY